MWLSARTTGAVVREAARERIGTEIIGAVVRRSGTWASWTSLASDVKLAIRTQTSEPWATAAIVTTLALGIGATTAVYAVFNYAVFRPVPGVVDQEGLVSAFVSPDHGSRMRATMSDAHLRAVWEMPAFSGFAGYFSSSYPFQTSVSAAPETGRVTRVTEGYFDLLGVEARTGRLFRPDEYDEPGGGVVVISEHLWRTRFGGASSAIGAEVLILGHPFTIVGVVDDFRGIDKIRHEDLWVPVGPAGVLRPDRNVAHQNMVGRLAPGATLEAARQQAAEAVAAVDPIRVQDTEFTAVIFPGVTDGIGVTHGRLMSVYRTAMAGVSVLFLLACVNAANLLVARNVRRRRHLALKAALGASSLRVLREMVVEAAVVAAMAAAAGLAAAALMTPLFRSERLLSYLPALEGLAIDGRVAVYATVAACLSVFMAATIPAMLASRWDPQHGLQDAGPGIAAGGGRLRDGFVVLQIALSIALVACTGVLAQTLINLRTKDLGFDADGLYEFTLVPRTIGYDADRAAEFFRQVQARLTEEPGITGATFGWSGHLGPNRQNADVVTAGGEMIVEGAERRDVASGYFRTVGLRLVAGRVFTDQEASGGGQPVVVIDEALAAAVFGQQPAVGRQIYRMSARGELRPREVIGVVADSGARDLREEHLPALYLPLRFWTRATAHVRSSLSEAETAAAVQRAVRSIEPALPVDDVIPVRDRIEQVTAQERLLAKLGSILAGLALSIAVAGIYSAVACRVAERTRELGIRMALGASRRMIGVTVLGRVTLLVGLGTAAGMGLYVWASRFIEARLYGVSSADVATLGAAVVIISVAAVVAAWLPARRAARVDPTIAMRAG